MTKQLKPLEIEKVWENLPAIKTFHTYGEWAIRALEVWHTLTIQVIPKRWKNAIVRGIKNHEMLILVKWFNKHNLDLYYYDLHKDREK